VGYRKGSIDEWSSLTDSSVFVERLLMSCERAALALFTMPARRACRGSTFSARGITIPISPIPRTPDKIFEKTYKKEQVLKGKFQVFMYPRVESVLRVHALNRYSLTTLMDR
jgi:hypothetical protein